MTTITTEADGENALEDNKSTTKKLKASDKLSSWIQKQLNTIAKYTPFKGGRCPICSRFCRTNGTVSEIDVRYHKCTHCGITFKTIFKREYEDK